MAKKNLILISPEEALKLRINHDASELAWAKRMSDYYGCRPIKNNAESMYTFVADVFHAGRISGIRQMRCCGKQYYDTQSEIEAFGNYIGGKIGVKTREIIETFGEMINDAFAAGVAEGKKGVCGEKYG